VSRNLRIVLVAAAGIVVVLVVAWQAFDWGSGDEKTSTASPEAWAGGVCTALTTWKSDLGSVSNNVKASPTKAGLQQGASDAKAATKQLADTLTGLGTPSTEAGNEARDALAKLQTQLNDDVATIEQATDDVSEGSGSMETVSEVSATLVTMRDQVEAAGTTLRGLPSGDLQQAFVEAPSCASLRTAVSAG
jgi:hypothetical protein